MKTSYTKLYAALNTSSKETVTTTKVAMSLLAASAFISFPAYADGVKTKSLPEAQLPAITVTATRMPTKATNTIAQTTVINSEELKRYQGQTVLDVLKRQAGISFYQSGGKGTVSNFYLRGYDSKSVLVLIDGIRYSSTSTGQPALGLLPVDQIDHIEVLYGASGSSIYGADAVGGVIQIFTKGSNIDQSQFSVTVGAGSHDEKSYGAAAQFKNEQGTRLSLAASHNETDSINATLPSNSSHNPDDDGFENDNYSIALNQKVNDKLSIGANALYSESTTDIDASKDWNTGAPPLTNAFANQNNAAGNIHLEYNTATSNTKLNYGISIDESTTYTTDINNGSKYDTKQEQASLVRIQNLASGKVIYGAEYLKQSLDSTKYTADDRKVKSGFLGYTVAANKFDAQANVRYDDFSDFDNETTYNLGAAYHLTPELRVGASYAKGYRVPTFNALYYPGFDNPDLKPETSDSYEAFIDLNTVLHSARLTAYRNNVDDLIAWGSGKNENINKAKIEGVTLTSDWYLDNYLLGFNYDYQKALDDSGKTNHGHYLPLRPEHKGMVYVGYQLPSLDVRAEYQYVDDYFYNVSNTAANKVDGYGLLNLSGSYEITPSLSMTARLNNVTNKKYVTAPDYNTDGTNFSTALTYTWK